MKMNKNSSLLLKLGGECVLVKLHKIQTCSMYSVINANNGFMWIVSRAVTLRILMFVSNAINNNKVVLVLLAYDD
jgi:hypothetical protein